MSTQQRPEVGPHFYGIGAMRGGTTWVYRCLDAHPEISFPAGKQVHFWDKNRESGFDNYVASFEGATTPLTGEITPAYAVLNRETVAEVGKALPHLRVFFIMRHPVDRAWSSVKLKVRRENLDPKGLDEAWLKETVSAKGMQRRNAYKGTIRRWTSVLGSDAVLLLDHAQISTDPHAMLESVASHIGADASMIRTDPAIAAEIGEVRNAGKPVDLPDPIRDLMQELYADDIAFYEDFSSSS